jgi:hypothetical protein
MEFAAPPQVHVKSTSGPREVHGLAKVTTVVSRSSAMVQAYAIPSSLFLWLLMITLA